jgi:hypothetical protein
MAERLGIGVGVDHEHSHVAPFQDA